ncbi:HepT-like ribonuclease domain-containing protein [Thioalkalivibrio paradoxus]|uniref:DUF86 domain-containing protein n=1 Tax=Thioalkalivibrio paradoxus ARh 1 TaxID=713585 RepID=W0DKH9_9GAMM|nr:DUF86 domain-containing protein [Thioalkalivibrio paradoxus]AHE97722.1 hypothetical protein THITH_04985 [Thioalkalivibrio paradoxus ARh 1]
MSRSSLEFLRHILDELEYLSAEAQILDLRQLQTDARAKRAVVRSLEIVGEAAKQLSEDLRARHPEVPWRALTAMRDKMIHHYFGVDYEIVWDVLATKVPGLRAQIRQVLEDEGRLEGG